MRTVQGVRLDILMNLQPNVAHEATLRFLPFASKLCSGGRQLILGDKDGELAEFQCASQDPNTLLRVVKLPLREELPDNSPSVSPSRLTRPSPSPPPHSSLWDTTILCFFCLFVFLVYLFYF